MPLLFGSKLNFQLGTILFHYGIIYSMVYRFCWVCFCACFMYGKVIPVFVG
uniref:Uncharacterized protein n=1 Tax=Rhizophora mucronata TaxID=61149 RepID=A0A2P2JT33_RHIMU